MAKKKKTKKAEYEYLDQYLRVRLTSDEKKLLKKWADENEVSISFYVRRKLFNDDLNMFMRRNNKTFL